MQFTFKQVCAGRGRPSGVASTTGFSFALALAFATFSSGSAAIVANFEGETASSTSVPAGWTLFNGTAGTDFSVTAAGLGSNGSGGDAGLGVEVVGRGSFPNGFFIPATHLASDVVFDVSQAITGTFEVRNVGGSAGFADFGFVFGDIDGSLAGGAAGDFLSFNSSGSSRGGNLVAGDAASLDSSATGVVPDQWYEVQFAWTPDGTGTNTGDFTATLNDFTNDIYTLTTTGFTFADSDAQFGFGSLNDRARFDNFNITAVPEPGSMGLLACGTLALWGRRRRRRNAAASLDTGS